MYNLGGPRSTLQRRRLMPQKVDDSLRLAAGWPAVYTKGAAKYLKLRSPRSKFRKRWERDSNLGLESGALTTPQGIVGSTPAADPETWARGSTRLRRTTDGAAHLMFDEDSHGRDVRLTRVVDEPAHVAVHLGVDAVEIVFVLLRTKYKNQRE